MELLRRAFDNPSFAKQFDSSCKQRVPDDASWRDYGRIYKSFAERGTMELQSIKARLDLIPEIGRVENFHAESDEVITHTTDVFVVHGHDEGAKESVARFIDKIGLQAIILHEQASLNRTIIEKLEHHSSVSFAVVLLTPDDIGYPLGRSELAKTRARQNVIFELGYFVGKLGRNRVCALYKGDVEIPSDYHGVIYMALDQTGAWRTQLAKEIRAAGIKIDMNKAF